MTAPSVRTHAVVASGNRSPVTAALVPIGLSIFFLSALVYYHVALAGREVYDNPFQGMVVWLYDFLGFVPAFVLWLLVLSWSSIWFLAGELERPWARAGRIALLTVCMAVLVNLPPDANQVYKGSLGLALATALHGMLGYILSVLLVVPATLAGGLLATDFFFYRYFEGLGRRTHEGLAAHVPATADLGVEDDATEAFKELAAAVSVPSPSSSPTQSPIPSSRRPSAGAGAALEADAAAPPVEAPAPVEAAAVVDLTEIDEEVHWEDEPLADEPLADEPLAYEPLAYEPLANEPLANEPLANEPPTGGPSAWAEDALDEGLAPAAEPRSDLAEEPAPLEPEALDAEDDAGAPPYGGVEGTAVDDGVEDEEEDELAYDEEEGVEDDEDAEDVEGEDEDELAYDEDDEEADEAEADDVEEDDEDELAYEEDEEDVEDDEDVEEDEDELAYEEEDEADEDEEGVEEEGEDELAYDDEEEEEEDEDDDVEEEDEDELAYEEDDEEADEDEDDAEEVEDDDEDFELEYEEDVDEEDVDEAEVSSEAAPEEAATAARADAGMLPFDDPTPAPAAAAAEEVAAEAEEAHEAIEDAREAEEAYPADEPVTVLPAMPPVEPAPAGSVDGELLAEATDLVQGSGRASASFLQRRLRVDYEEAVDLLQALQAQGVVALEDGGTQGRVL